MNDLDCSDFTVEQVERILKWHVHAVTAETARARAEGARAALENLPTSIELSRKALRGPVLPDDDPNKDKIYVAGVPLKAVAAALAALDKQEKTDGRTI